jgi:hypothetical protein
VREGWQVQGRHLSFLNHGGRVAGVHVLTIPGLKQIMCTALINIIPPPRYQRRNRKPAPMSPHAGRGFIDQLPAHQTGPLAEREQNSAQPQTAQKHARRRHQLRWAFFVELRFAQAAPGSRDPEVAATMARCQSRLARVPSSLLILKGSTALTLCRRC